MIVPTAVEQRARNSRPYWNTVRDIVRDTMRPFCEDRQYGFVIRVKETESIAEKIESGRYARWDDLDDLVACAVVIPAYSHEDGVLDFLRQAFAEYECRVRGSARKASDVFRFDSTRFIARLRPRDDTPRPPVVDQTLFEVQIRSAFEHAWSTATHSLVYKAADVDWRKLRLAAQLKAAVEQIDLLVQGFEQSAEVLRPSPWPELDEQAALQAVISQKFGAGALPSHLAPKDWSRVMGNLHGLLRASSRSRQGTADRVGQAIEALERRITVDTVGSVPVSCSLWQVVAGSLAEEGVLRAPPQNFTPLVTDTMLSFYPSASNLGTSFVL